MTAGLVKKWLIAELKTISGTGIPAIVGTPPYVATMALDLPAKPGIYVDIITDSYRARWSDFLNVQILCAAKTEAQCHTLCEAVIKKLHANAGESKTWASPPTGLKMSYIRRGESEPASAMPAENGQAAMYVALLRYTISARADSMDP
jgi:hypothetical protein